MADNIDTSAPAESTDTTQEQSQNNVAPKPGAPEPTPKSITEAAIKKYKVKIDGAESEVDEQELIRGYQLRKVSDSRLQEAMQARKQSEEFVRLLKDNPIQLLSDPRIGVDIKKLAEDFLLEEIKKEQMSPDQRELSEAKKKLQKYEQWQKQQEEEQIKQKDAQLVEHYQKSYQTEIIDALETSGLPKTQATVNRMIYYMSQALQNGYEMGAKDVVDIVKKDYMQETKDLYANMPEDKLYELLGDDLAKKVVKADLNRLKKANKSTQTYNDPKVTGQSSEKKKYISTQQFRDRLQKIKDGEEE